MPFIRFVPLIRLCCKRLWSQDYCQKPWTFVHRFHFEQVPKFNVKNITTIDPYSVRFACPTELPQSFPSMHNNQRNNLFHHIKLFCQCRILSRKRLQNCRSCKKMVHFLSLNVVSASNVIWSGCTENASIDSCPLLNIHLILIHVFQYFYSEGINYIGIKLIWFYSHCLQLFFNLRYVLVEHIWRKLWTKSIFDGSKRLYIHITGVNYGMDGKKITDKICISIVCVK